MRIAIVILFALSAVLNAAVPSFLGASRFATQPVRVTTSTTTSGYVLQYALDPTTNNSTGIGNGTQYGIAYRYNGTNTGYTLRRVAVKVGIVGSPATTLSCYIYSYAGGVGSMLTNSTTTIVNGAGLSTTPGFVNFDFDGYAMGATTNYFVFFASAAGSSSHYYTFPYLSTGDGTVSINRTTSAYPGASWTSVDGDCTPAFKLYSYTP